MRGSVASESLRSLSFNEPYLLIRAEYDLFRRRTESLALGDYEA